MLPLELLALVALSCTQGTEPPPAPTRLIAEWEPALGALVAWPLRVPDQLVVELASDDRLYLLLQEEHEVAAREKLAELEIDEDAVSFIACSVVSQWPRDWGPHQVFDGNGVWHMIDHVFEGYPYFARESEDGEPRTVWRTGPGDDLVCAEVARALGAPVVEFPAVLTGGNFLVDGHGTAFCTRAQIDENRKHLDEASLRVLLATHAGIDRLVVLENTEPDGIQHIDCWLKVLDAERLLVKRAPAGHPEAAPIERNLAVLSTLRNAFGRPYEILRIDCPEVPVRRTGRGDSTPIAAYTNSLILNGKVLVPLFGVPGDEVALETWREALPGYEVIGFPWDRWLHFDALHCRTRAVFDRDMLRLEHPRLPDEVPFTKAGHPVSAVIQAMGSTSLDAAGCSVRHRKVGEETWQVAPLLPLHVEDRWVAVLPSVPKGTRMEYHVVARDTDGRERTHPPGAPAAVHRFVVVD